MKAETKFDVGDKLLYKGEIPVVVHGIVFRSFYVPTNFKETSSRYEVSEIEKRQRLGPGSWCLAEEEELDSNVVCILNEQPVGERDE